MSEVGRPVPPHRSGGGVRPSPPAGPSARWLRVCVAVDDYKLALFEERLREAGYTWEQGPGLSAGTLHLYVMVPATEIGRLEAVARRANNETRKDRS